MTGIDGRRIATAGGAMLALDEQLGGADDAAVERIFEPSHWRGAGRIEPVARGRGSAWFIRDGSRDWVLRHFRRGGFIAESIAELRKVDWPNRAQTIQGTVVVIIAVLIVGAYLWGIDQIIRPFVRNVLLGQ